MPEPRVVILGGGPAGVGAAYRLRRLGAATVDLVEQRDSVGGNAGSFEFGGQRVDYGSHRLHPSCDPEILDDIRRLLGEDLLRRPRHGRIRLRGRWIHFPLRPLDLLLRLDRGFALGALGDMVGRALPFGGDGAEAEEETFASILREGLGGTICEHFYFPYARKIWGHEPEELSAIQARRRVAAGSAGKLVRKVLGRVPGVKPIGFSHYFYPRRGYGAISEAYADGARKLGARLHLGWRVSRLERGGGAGDPPWRVVAERDGETHVLEADHVWSTVPITVLARLAPDAPARVIEAARGMSYRSMVLVYLTVPVDRFTEYDAHYFPSEDVAITRLSETKVYADLDAPRGRTTLCAELPCSRGDRWWEMPEADLGRAVAADLERVGIPLPAPPAAVGIRRLSHAYPVYDRGYEERFDTLDAWARGLPGVLTYGRQGLFAHDNTHHALYMAYAAAECLAGKSFDAERWASYRREFESHVVED